MSSLVRVRVSPNPNLNPNPNPNPNPNQATSRALPLLTLPKHTPGCTYPMLLRLRLLPDEGASAMDTEDAEEGAAPESGGAAGRGGTMAAAERTLFEEYTSMVAQSFFESHRDGAKQLQALQEYTPTPTTTPTPTPTPTPNPNSNPNPIPIPNPSLTLTLARRAAAPQ